VAQVCAVAVIGAGMMGRRIAHLAALSGYRTIVEDLLPSSLRKAEHEFRISLDEAIGSGRVSAADAPSAFRRLEYAGSVEEAARQADLVIEAVPEELESKSEILILLDKICRPATILVTSARTLSVTQLANVTYRADKCVGMRFVHPVYEMRRLEVVRGRETSDDTLFNASAVGKRMGKEIVLIEEMAASRPAVSI
jgi:3-hydroxybutyryl-CoA dehydrogenase